MPNNYDALAGSYDFLSGLIFGNAIRRSQIEMLSYIAPQSYILIAGGGTGWILQELAKVHSSSLDITYVDASPKMIQSARLKSNSQNTVRFVCAPVESYIPTQKFDVIITPFLFDNFSNQQAIQNFHKLHKMLKLGGKWLFADFYIDEFKGKSWQKVLLRTMYLFFRLICKIETQELLDMNPYFENNGYELEYNGFYYSDFIRSCIWRRTGC